MDARIEPADFRKSPDHPIHPFLRAHNADRANHDRCVRQFGRAVVRSRIKLPHIDPVVADVNFPLRKDKRTLERLCYCVRINNYGIRKPIGEWKCDTAEAIIHTAIRQLRRNNHGCALEACGGRGKQIGRHVEGVDNFYSVLANVLPKQPGRAEGRQAYERIHWKLDDRYPGRLHVWSARAAWLEYADMRKKAASIQSNRELGSIPLAAAVA